MEREEKQRPVTLILTNGPVGDYKEGLYSGKMRDVYLFTRFHYDEFSTFHGFRGLLPGIDEVFFHLDLNSGRYSPVDNILHNEGVEGLTIVTCDCFRKETEALARTHGLKTIIEKDCGSQETFRKIIECKLKDEENENGSE